MGTRPEDALGMICLWMYGDRSGDKTIGCVCGETVFRMWGHMLIFGDVWGHGRDGKEARHEAGDINLY